LKNSLIFLYNGSVSVPLNPEIVRRSDFRGIYPTQINMTVARRIGMALVKWLRSETNKSVITIGVGRDVRPSSGELATGLVEGIIESFGNVLDVGLVGTEVMNFAASMLDVDATVMVSASHNPRQYNGLKIHRRGTVPVGIDNGLWDIHGLASADITPGCHGTIRSMPILTMWSSWMAQFIRPDKVKPLHLVMDAGNGMAGMLLDELLPKLPIKVTKMYFLPDGEFPHHLPNPLIPENVKDLVGEVVRQRADFGVAFDGDTDRIVFVDQLGKPRSASAILAMLAKETLSLYPAAAIVFNAVCGRTVPETIVRFGGKPFRTKTGHSIIRMLMQQTHAPLAGEHSGHFYFRNYFSADSSMYTLIKVLEIASAYDGPFSRLIDEFDPYPQSGEINFQTDQKERLASEIRKLYVSRARAYDEIDGMSIWFDRWWFNLRTSQNEDLLRLNVEADTSDILQKKTKEIINYIHQFGGQEQ
jgi:phosphomannomutase